MNESDPRSNVHYLGSSENSLHLDLQIFVRTSITSRFKSIF